MSAKSSIASIQEDPFSQLPMDGDSCEIFQAESETHPNPASNGTPIKAQSSKKADRESAKLTLAQMQDVLLARFIGREEATRMGFPPQALIRIATAISEISRNVIQHSGAQGQISFFDISENGRRGLKIIVSDNGCGIERVEDLLKDRGQAFGAGIAGTRRIMDEFQIETAHGGGTTVTMAKWLSSTE